MPRAARAAPRAVPARGKNDTATALLPVTSRTGTPYTATETKAPAGYQLDSKPVKFTAEAGSPVTVTLTNTKT
ncbi:SpaA isopeptide-forming pilin-related protein [Streptomyces sp. NPDC059568]|uniref:SpaA isopeptide-forming pilin-related protein n=1 Tax=Streptomyces sp. NPDC059568 TaxID=3346868 RepID=UPI003685D015